VSQSKAKRYEYHRLYYLRNREKIRAQAKARYPPTEPRPKKKDREFLYLRYYEGQQGQHGLSVTPRSGDYIFKNTGKRVK